MLRKTDFYIDGKWTTPAAARELEVINPADEQAYAPLRGQAARFADARRSLWLVLVDEAFKGRVCDGTPTGG